MTKSVSKSFRGEKHGDWNRGRIKGTGNSSNLPSAPIPLEVINDLLAYFDFGVGTDNFGGFSEVSDTGSASELFRKMAMNSQLQGICVVDDFHSADYTTAAATLKGKWLATVTQAGAGSATVVAAASQIVVTNDDADNDSVFFQLSMNDAAGAVAPFSFVENDGKPGYFEISLNLTDVTNTDFIAGFVGTASADPVDTAPVDGIYFNKASGADTIVLSVAKDSTATTSAALHTLVDGTDVILGISWDGVGTIKAYVDGALVLTQTTMTNLPDDINVGALFGHQNGGAAAEVADFNKIIVYKDA